MINPFRRKIVQQQPTRQPKVEKCEVKVRPLKGGGYKKEISGSCTKEQIRALVESGQLDASGYQESHNLE